MPNLELVDPSMFDEIHRHLLTLLDRSRPKEEWRRIFEYSWPRPEEHVGYALYEDGEPVAFLGLLFHERELGGATRRFCNVSSWIAKKPYRQQATLLVLALRRLDGYTITNLSPNRIAYEVFERLGFQELETHWTILSPGRILRPSTFTSEVRLSGSRDRLDEVLDDTCSRILDDHRDSAHHAVAEFPGGYCYVVYTLARRRYLPSVRIHFFSDRDGFEKSLPRLQLYWLRWHGAVLTECDSRLLEGVELPWSHRVSRTIPRLYRSSELEGSQIDNLYSEVVLLNLV